MATEANKQRKVVEGDKQRRKEMVATEANRQRRVARGLPWTWPYYDVLPSTIRKGESWRNATATPRRCRNGSLYPDKNTEQSPDYWAAKAVDLPTMRSYRIT